MCYTPDWDRLDLSELLEIDRQTRSPSIFIDLDQLGPKFPVFQSLILPYKEHILEVSFCRYYSVIGGEDLAMVTTNHVIDYGDNTFRIAIALHESGGWVVCTTLSSGDSLLMEKYPAAIGPYLNIADAVAMCMICFPKR